MEFSNSISFARAEDEKDGLRSFRERFNIPKISGNEVTYLCGNSLGLHPKKADDYVREELSTWAELGVEGHFRGKNPWAEYHKLVEDDLCLLTGGLPGEVVAMNSLTVNLHLMLETFYRPAGRRFKVLTEFIPFSSDHYALESVMKSHGIDPAEGIVELKPDEGEFLVSARAIIHQVDTLGDSLAMVLISPVNYLTGQYYDIPLIIDSAHKSGAIAGLDLAHTIGNVPLNLHEWKADFAVWCSYKYLNSGPGGVGGLFVHERHGNDTDLPRLAGWWGHERHTRFRMERGFRAAVGAEGWQLSNAPVLSLAVKRAALEVFRDAGMDRLRAKSIRLTAFLEYLLQENIIKKDNRYGLKLVTPREPERRGCQLSLMFSEKAKDIFLKLTQANFVVDFREPGIIRVSPVPLYNRFSDVYHFVDFLAGL